MTLFTPDLDAPQWQRLSNDPAVVRFRRLFQFVKRKAHEYSKDSREFKYRPP